MPKRKPASTRVCPPGAVVDIADRAFRNGITTVEVRKAAGVHNSTWMRWVRGEMLPTGPTLKKLNAALDQLIKGD